MYKAFVDTENLFDIRDKRCRKTKQRMCQKSHGILNGFRELSLVGRGESSFALERSLAPRHDVDDGSLGDDCKSNASDCDSLASDDSCLWEIFQMEDGPIYSIAKKIASPKKEPTKFKLRPRYFLASPKVLKEKLSPKVQELKSPSIKKISSPMVVGTPNNSPEKAKKICPVDQISQVRKSPLKKKSPVMKKSPLLKKRHSSKDCTTPDLKDAKNKKKLSPIKSESKSTKSVSKALVKKDTPKESSLDPLAPVEKTNQKTSQIKSNHSDILFNITNTGNANLKENIHVTEKSIIRMNMKPISSYFPKKSKLKLHSPLSKSTPKHSLHSSKHSSQHSSSFVVHRKDSAFKQFKSLAKCSQNNKKGSLMVSFEETPQTKAKSFKRHHSMLETSPADVDDIRSGKLPKRGFAFSEPRIKRKIDLSLHADSSDECTQNKRARRLIDLENLQKDSLPTNKESFFVPISCKSDDLGVTPIKSSKECKSCGTCDTPLWRDEDKGTPLCNACGIRWKKYRVRCTRCWYVPMKEENAIPYCSSCGHYNTVKRANRLRRYTSSIY